ncbi:MAG: GTPase Era [Actinobacteria bacterium]|nr:GTPase Era [Actinomycetota bacterium]NBY15993.1 GTPase Era [Actinomycetota bacterium]
MTEFQSGFACIVGRPNVGKSTLTNAIIGQKVAITSDKPQTTRHVIRGIVHRTNAQLVIIDTPGVHKPRTLLGERLNALVSDTWSEVDLVVMCFPADEPIGPGDQFIATELASVPKVRKIAVVTKTDKATKQQVGDQLVAVANLGQELGIDWLHLVPVSAVAGDQVELLADLLIEELPIGSALYPDGELTDEPEQVMIAELVREAALAGVRDELPHSIAVVVEEMALREGRSNDNPLMDIYVHLYVERESQKHIVIGKGGSRLKEVGISARTAISKLLGVQVHLDLRVKVAKDWQRDPKQLHRLGF